MDHIHNQSHELQNTNPTSSWNNLDNMGMEPHHLLHLHHNIPITPPIWPLPPPPPPWSSATPAITAAQDRQLIISVNNDEQILTENQDQDQEELGAMKEMMYKIAAMQPVDIDPATLRRPKRRNVRISDDPQSVAARLRRERTSEKIRILQRLVPGGTKMDTASMLEEAIRYVKFLKAQIRHLQSYRRPPSPSTCIISGSPSTAVASSSHSHHSLTSFNHKVIRD